MKLSARNSNGIWIIGLSGNLVVETGDALRDFVLSLLKEGHQNILVNMKDVPYMDSHGIGALWVSLQRAREAGGNLKLFKVSEKVYNILIFADFRAEPYRFEIFKDESAAIASFSVER